MKRWPKKPRKRGKPWTPGMQPTPGMLYRDCVERLEAREQNHAAERARQRAARLSAQAPQTVALMADDANCKVRRVRRLDGIERAFRRGFLRGRDDLYRVARCLEADWLSLLPPAGGLRLERLPRGLSESFALMPGAPGVSTAAPQARRAGALARLRLGEEACGRVRDFAMLRAWAVENFSLREIAARWRCDNATIGARLRAALERIDEGPWDAQLRRRAPPYDDRKWRVDVLAEEV